MTRAITPRRQTGQVSQRQSWRVAPKIGQADA
jgi:hypothetical protein